MENLLKRFWGDETGLELSEYAIMVALIVVALVLVIGYLSGAIQGAFSRTASVIDGPPAAGS